MPGPHQQDLPSRRQAAPRAAHFVLFVLFVAGLGGLGGAGCAIPINVTDLNKDIPKAAMPIAIRSGLDTMSEPETARRLQRLLADPELRAVQQNLVAGLLDGTLATLSDKERADRIGALTTRALMAVLGGASRELTAGIAGVTQGAMNGALDAALNQGRQHELETLLTAVIAASIRALVQGLREAELGKTLTAFLTEELGPALGKSVRQDAAPALAELLRNDELNRALGATARVLGREMVLGATEALAHAQPPREEGSLLSRVTELAHQGARLFGSAAWVLLLIILALGAWTLKLVAQSRSYREEADRRAATVRLLADATAIAQGKPWSDDLIAALQERIRREEQTLAELRQVKRRSARGS